MRTTCGVCIVAVLGVGSGSVLSAQQGPDLTAPQPNILLANYNTVPVGPNAGLESGAYTARVGDPSAAWINPAGLSRGVSAELSGSSGVYQLATVSPSSFPNTGGSIQDIPSLVGFTVPKLFGGSWTLGVAVLTANSWSQHTDTEIVTSQPDGLERFSYSADSQFQQTAVAASLGYVSGRWRFGGGFALMETNILRDEVLSNRLATSTSLLSLLIDSRVEGSAIQIRPIAGVQYDASSHYRFGLAIRTPALSLYRSGSYTADAIADGGPASQGISFFDPAADFTYHFPFEIHAGAAYVSPRVEGELDLHAFTPISAYTMVSSGKPIITYVDQGTSTPPVIGTQAFNGFVSESRGLVNVSAGGHVALTSSGVWRIHLGVQTDLSPSGSRDQVFTHVNRYGGTLGVSGTKGKVQFTAGLDYRSGTSGDIFLRTVSSNDTIPTTIRVRTIGLIYAVSYKF